MKLIVRIMWVVILIVSGIITYYEESTLAAAIAYTAFAFVLIGIKNAAGAILSKIEAKQRGKKYEY